MLVHNCPVCQKMYKTVAGKMLWVKTDIRIIRPGGKLGKHTGHAVVLNAILSGLHIFMNMSQKYAAKAIASGKKRLMQTLPVQDQHVVVHPNGV